MTLISGVRLRPGGPGDGHRPAQSGQQLQFGPRVTELPGPGQETLPHDHPGLFDVSRVARRPVWGYGRLHAAPGAPAAGLEPGGFWDEPSLDRKSVV